MPKIKPSDEVAALKAEVSALKAELQRTQLACRMAQEAEQFKAGFLARTSHELRSPLNGVMSLQQLILSDLCEDAAEEREFVAQSYASAQQLLSLLDKLVNVSKAVYGTEQLQLQPVCLEDVLMEVESMLMLQARNRRQELQLDYPAPEVNVLADPRWLKQVLVSLLDTPMRLMQEGVIRVKTQVDPAAQQVQLLIEDERPAQFWSEPLDLLATLKTRGKFDDKTDRATALTDLEGGASPGLSLLVNQTLVELMGGQLAVLAVPTEESPISRVQCTLMLAM
jgi:signal transduction histidine kinase